MANLASMTLCNNIVHQYEVTLALCNICEKNVCVQMQQMALWNDAQYTVYVLLFVITHQYLVATTGLQKQLPHEVHGIEYTCSCP